MAYCPPGSICGMLSNPRALPPVTQGSPFQAPERIGENPLTESKTKTKLNPLERMEDDALAAMLPLWSYKSELLTPKPEAYHHLHS